MIRPSTTPANSLAHATPAQIGKLVNALLTKELPPGLRWVDGEGSDDFRNEVRDAISKSAQWDDVLLGVDRGRDVTGDGVRPGRAKLSLECVCYVEDDVVDVPRKEFWIVVGPHDQEVAVTIHDAEWVDDGDACVVDASWGGAR